MNPNQRTLTYITIHDNERHLTGSDKNETGKVLFSPYRLYTTSRNVTYRIRCPERSDLDQDQFVFLKNLIFSGRDQMKLLWSWDLRCQSWWKK